MSVPETRIAVSEWLASTSAVAGVIAVGLAQPLLDLYGRNPELFSAAKLPQREVILFSLMVALVPPLLWALVAACLVRAPAAFRVWRAIGIGVGGALAALVLLRKADIAAPISFAVAALAGVGLALLVERLRVLRSVFTVLGFLAPATAILFLVASPQARYTWGGTAQAKPLATIPSTPPIVWVVFDETNLPLLMKDDGTIDGKRYPNLAALIGTSTWYRNATGVDNFTPRAVPAMLASQDGSGNRRPVTKDYPINVFTLLGGTFKIDAVQPVTDMCPRVYCAATAEGGRERFRDFMRDAGIVYGHLALPKTVGDRLPAIDDAWGGFNDGNGTTVDPNDPLAKVRKVSRGPTQQFGVFEDWASRIRAGEAPTFHFAHVLIPHRPWRATPDGKSYENIADLVLTDLNPSEQWPERLRAQRYTVQAGLYDTSIGLLRKQLEDTGLWDKAIVIVTADHGINLEGGSHVREPNPDGQLDELYRVPLVIKSPGQTAGVVSDVPASTQDILPTLLGLLGAQRPPGLLGVDLRTSVPADRARKVWAHGKSMAFESGTAGLTKTIGIYDTWFPIAQSGWARVLQVGPFGKLVGKKVATTGPAPAGVSWRIVAPSNMSTNPGRSVALFEARVVIPGGAAPADGTLLVIHDGIVVGTLGGAVKDGDGWKVSGMLDWRRLTGKITVDLALASGTAAKPTLALLPRPA